MDSHSMRITIEFPQGADVQSTVGMTGDSRAGMPVSGNAIDAGPPPPALLMTLGDPDVSFTEATVTDYPTIGSTEAISAGPFSAELAMEMEATGPRHPLGHPEIGILASGTSPILSPEARN